MGNSGWVNTIMRRECTRVVLVLISDSLFFTRGRGKTKKGEE